MLISFVLPFYNINKEYFEKCMTSLINQGDNCEIIIVDDGSDELHKSFCDEWEQDNDNIKVYHLEHLGVSNARNYGVMKASGEWIAFVDPDDWVEENYCKDLSKIINPEYDICVFSYRDVYPEKCVDNLYGDKKIIELSQDIISKIDLGLISYKYSVFPPVFGAIWNMLYRKDFIINNNIKFDNALVKSQDLFFNVLAFNACNKVIYFNEVLYNYRHNSSSICNAFNPNIVIILETLLEKIYVYLEEKHKLNAFQYNLALSDRYYQTLKAYLKLCLCNDKNQTSYKERKNIFIKVLNNNYKKIDLYVEILKNSNYKEYVIFYCIKFKLYFLLNLIYKFSQKKNRKMLYD